MRLHVQSILQVCITPPSQVRMHMQCVFNVAKHNQFPESEKNDILFASRNYSRSVDHLHVAFFSLGAKVESVRFGVV